MIKIKVKYKTLWLPIWFIYDSITTKGSSYLRLSTYFRLCFRLSRKIKDLEANSIIWVNIMVEKMNEGHNEILHFSSYDLSWSFCTLNFDCLHSKGSNITVNEWNQVMKKMTQLDAAFAGDSPIYATFTQEMPVHYTLYFCSNNIIYFYT